MSPKVMTKITHPALAATSERTTKALAELGLNPSEALLYTALITLGPSSALRLSKATNLKRSTVYTLFSNLAGQGLANVQVKGFKRLFAAENPERLQALLDKKRSLLNLILPELTTRFFNLQDSDSFIKHYQGIKGVKSIYDTLLDEIKPNGFYYVISDQQKWLQLDPRYFEEFRTKRAKRFHTKLLLQESPSARGNLKTVELHNEEIKIFPPDTAFNANLVIVPHKLIVVQTVEPVMAMVIENPSLIHMTRVMFEMIWKFLPAPNCFAPS